MWIVASRERRPLRLFNFSHEAPSLISPFRRDRGMHRTDICHIRPAIPFPRAMPSGSSSSRGSAWLSLIPQSYTKSSLRSFGVGSHGSLLCTGVQSITCKYTTLAKYTRLPIISIYQTRTEKWSPFRWYSTRRGWPRLYISAASNRTIESPINNLQPLRLLLAKTR
jgi:hypothetical protein